MKLTINGVEQKESEFKGETLEAILDMMVKNTPGSYIRRIWPDSPYIGTRCIFHHHIKNRF